MWVVSSLRYSWTEVPGGSASDHAMGSGYRSRWVSALRRASASISRTALSTHERGWLRTAVAALSVVICPRVWGHDTLYRRMRALSPHSPTVLTAPIRSDATPPSFPHQGHRSGPPPTSVA